MCTFVYDINDKKGRESLWNDVRGLASNLIP